MAFRAVWTGGSMAIAAALCAPWAGGAAIASDPEVGSTVVTVYGTRETRDEPESSAVTRTATALKDLPQSVYVISGEVIAEQAMTGLGELVRYVPGVVMGQGEGHRDAPVFRGNLTTADFFVDGVRDDLQYLRDLYNVERVEVVKGPAALAFGRGTGGGALNRLLKGADGERVRALEVALGMQGHSRVAADVGGAWGTRGAVRLNAVTEDSRSFREGVEVIRQGVSPAGRWQLDDQTRLEIFGEYFADQRTVDRGVPSQGGRPWPGARGTFFGNPELSRSEIEVLSARGVLSHDFDDRVSVKATVAYGEYLKSYDNVYAGGEVDRTGTRASIAAYRVASDRQNLFAQVDVVWRTEWLGHEHRVLLGVESGRQRSANIRVNAASAVFPLTDRGRTYTPDFSVPAALDNDNDLRLAAVLLQDQISLSPTVKAVIGVRWDNFDLRFDDRRPRSVDFSRRDRFLSPRAGLVWEPVAGLSAFGGWSRAHLPQSGEQFNSLTASLVALEPEEFESIELGLRGEAASSLAWSAAAYQLERTNTRAPGASPGTTVLTGSQRSQGLEIGLQGRALEGWQMIGAMAIQRSVITSTTAAAPAGRSAPLVPRFSASLWNRVALAAGLDIAVGVIHQGKQFASISNEVTLPAFTRFDAAAFYALDERTTIQLNLANLGNARYWYSAHNDNNISPAAGIAARIIWSSRF